MNLTQLKQGTGILLASSLAILSAPSLALADCGPQVEGCIECGPHWTDWYLEYCPWGNNTPSVNPTIYYCTEVGKPPPVPSVTKPTYAAGSKVKYGFYDCKADLAEQHAGIIYTVGDVQWDPPLPGIFSELHVPSFSSWAYVNVTSGDPAFCPSPGRVDIGYCTWDIASGITETWSVSLPKTEYLSDWLDSVASRAPTFIRSISFDIQGTVSRQTGQKCCSSIPTDGPSSYEKYTGSVSAKLNISLVVPGTSWVGNYSGTTPVEYYLGWDVTLGPSLTVTPSGTASASGILYANTNCGGCITTTVNGTCTVKLSYGATASVFGRIFESGQWYSIDVNATISIVGSASVSGSAAGTYSYGEGCPTAGFYGGSFNLGSCDVGFTATGTISGYGLSFTKNVHLWDGWSA